MLSVPLPFSQKATVCPTNSPFSPQVGRLIDETGAVTSGKLVWSDEAWEQLLGRNAEGLVGASQALLKYLEHRLLFLKLAVMFGWSEDVGKLCVLRVTIV